MPLPHAVSMLSALALTLSGLPSQVTDDDEAAKRFDLLILRRQLAQIAANGVLGDVKPLA